MIRFKLFCFAVICCLNIQCGRKKTIDKNELKTNIIDEKDYVIDSSYSVGDVRRYGIYPDSLNNTKHPLTNKYKIQTVLDFAEESGTTINFPPGYYGMNLHIDSRESIHLNFDNSEFNLITITNARGKESKNINLRGSLIGYSGFGSYSSRNIFIDTLILKTDLNKNLDNLRNKGCHIYKGTKFVNIKYLEIEDLGSGSEAYKNSHAALTIDGQFNNPENISIIKTVIKSSDRHGAYITGNNHYFEKLIIKRYAAGSSKHMVPLQDAIREDSYLLSGLWINRCNNTIFGEVKITTKNSQKGVPIKLDEGNVSYPTVIEAIVLDTKYEDELIVDNISTNVIVKRLKLFEE